MINYLIFFLIVFIVIAAAGLIFTIKGKPDYEILKIEILDPATQLIKLQAEVEIADTMLKRTRGLSGRKCLKNDEGTCPELAEGMLFLFAKSGKYNFWMAGMNFPIDIIWIKENKIVDISKDVQPPKSNGLPVIISPSIKANRVLEVSAGAVEKFSIKIGDEITTKSVR